MIFSSLVRVNRNFAHHACGVCACGELRNLPYTANSATETAFFLTPLRRRIYTLRSVVRGAVAPYCTEKILGC